VNSETQTEFRAPTGSARAEGALRRIRVQEIDGAQHERRGADQKAQSEEQLVLELAHDAPASRSGSALDSYIVAKSGPIVSGFPAGSPRTQVLARARASIEGDPSPAVSGPESTGQLL
jgi:hypothetical protein